MLDILIVTFVLNISSRQKQVQQKQRRRKQGRQRCLPDGRSMNSKNQGEAKQVIFVGNHGMLLSSWLQFTVIVVVGIL